MRTPPDPHIQHVRALWRSYNPAFPAREKLPPPQFTAGAPDYFSPGPYYYFVFNCCDCCYDYMHPTLHKVLGYAPEAFTLEHFFDILHPDDAPLLLRKETAAYHFLFRQLSHEKRKCYLVSYQFRLRSAEGIYKNMLYQSVALDVSEDGKIRYLLGIHADISHLSALPDHRISFIGLHGEPSFLSVPLASPPEQFADLRLSDREKGIIRLLAEGMASKQVAAQLGISVHTVNTHRCNLLRKLRCKNTLELTALALRQGWI